MVAPDLQVEVKSKFIASSEAAFALGAFRRWYPVASAGCDPLFEIIPSNGRTS
jgi:hypothetical protein